MNRGQRESSSVMKSGTIDKTFLTPITCRLFKSLMLLFLLRFIWSLFNKLRKQPVPTQLPRPRAPGGVRLEAARDEGGDVITSGERKIDDRER